MSTKRSDKLNSNLMIDYLNKNKFQIPENMEFAEIFA